MWMLVNGELVNLSLCSKIKTKQLVNGKIGVVALQDRETHVLGEFPNQEEAQLYLEDLRPRLNGTRRQ